MAQAQMNGDNPSTDLARALVYQLADLGVKDWVICPGSRNAPLVYALAQAQKNGWLRTHVRLDERAAGFFALGLSKGYSLADRRLYAQKMPNLVAETGLEVPAPGEMLLEEYGRTRLGYRPVGVVVTSGTAVGELHPAVMEAYHGSVPLVIISADRPVSLRETGANQTTYQPEIFRHHVSAELELSAADLVGWQEWEPTPEQKQAVDQFLQELKTKGEPDTFQQLSEMQSKGLEDSFGPAVLKNYAQVNQIFRLAMGYRDGQGGPVHFNVSFAEPLNPTTDWQTHRCPPSGASTFIHLPAYPWAEKPKRGAVKEFDPGLRTVLIAGDDAASAVLQGAQIARIPIFCEPTAHRCAGLSNLVPHAPQVLSRLRLEVQQVVVAGRPTLSREVTWLLQREDLPIFVVQDASRYFDLLGTYQPLNRLTWLSFCNQLATRRRYDLDAASELGAQAGMEIQQQINRALTWLTRCQQLGARVEQVYQRLFDQDASGVDSDLQDPFAVARLVDRAHARVDAPALLLGASSTIRAFDQAIGPEGEGAQAVPVYLSNRGLSGIDGTAATGIGMATSAEEPIRVILGDLSFFHDLTGVLTGKCEDTPVVQILVLNDRGGSIFASLEHGRPEYAETFERYFSTPQRGKVAQLAAGLGWDYRQVKTRRQLQDILAAPVKREIIEINTQISDLRLRREALNEEVAALLAQDWQ